jgi:hypothetical protein
MQTLYTRRKNSDLPAGPYAEFFHKGGCMAYMAKKVPNIQRIINNDILKIVNIVFSGAGGGGSCPHPPLFTGCKQTVDDV